MGERTEETKPVRIDEVLRLLEELRELGIEPRGYNLRSPYERDWRWPPMPRNRAEVVS